MFEKLIPSIRLGSIFEITPELLLKRNIRLLMLDLDNTLAPYRDSKPSVRLMDWKDGLVSSGVRLVIVSNTKSDRAKNFSADLGIPYVDRARKPMTKKVLEVMKETGFRPEESALAGDQIFTDVWCANRAGALSIVVRPLELTNAFFLLRYWAEYVFRRLAPNHDKEGK